MPRIFDAAAVAAALPYDRLIDRLHAGFAAGIEAPVRHHHPVPRAGRDPAMLLLMPAWQADEVTGVKLVTVARGNEALGLPSVQGIYVLFDGPTGTPLAVMDGTALTVRRTAAASALAASHLARRDARVLAMIGAGALAPHLIRAHAAVRPVAEVRLWNRTRERAHVLAGQLHAEGFAVTVVDAVEAAMRGADIVSCATMSRVPLVCGAWVAPGTHVDLVGAYTPEMRESDDNLLRRAELFVDTRAGALAEAGDIVQAERAGALAPGGGSILADLHDLCRGHHPGRTAPQAVTVFKSVGSALEDLVAARLVYDRSAA